MICSLQTSSLLTWCWSGRPPRWPRWWWRCWLCSRPPRPRRPSRCPSSAPAHAPALHLGRLLAPGSPPGAAHRGWWCAGPLAGKTRCREEWKISLKSTVQRIMLKSEDIYLHLPGPFAPPGSNLPILNITALSYSWTTCKQISLRLRRSSEQKTWIM